MSNDLKVFREAAAGYKMIPVKSLPLVALQVIAADDEIERLEAKVAELDGRIAKALPVAAELDCMLASHAKSKKAYSKMQDKAEYLVQTLGEKE